MPETMPIWQDTKDGVTQVLAVDWLWCGLLLKAGVARSDGTSSPRGLRWLVPRRDRLVFASYIHDECLRRGMAWDKAARYFLYALKKLGASKRERAMRYRGVLLWGKLRRH